MALTTINAAKEAALTYQPLLLAEFAFTDGTTVLRVCTHPLNTAEGGYQYGGNDYLARIKDEDLAAIQMLSDQGIDRIPSVTLHLMDPDLYLWTYFEKALGFKGATLTLTFVFWEAGTSTYSSDSIVKFVGRCDPATHDQRILSVTANGSNLQKTNVPVLRCQARCPHVFPTTAAQRSAGYSNEDSEFWECGYCPESGRGNYETGTTPYTDCNYTRDDCLLRLGNSSTGDIGHDNDGTDTGSFAGITYSMAGSWYSKSYLDGKDVKVTNVGISGQMGKSYPMVYGVAWVRPLVLHSFADGNSVRCEAVLCAGKITGTPGSSAGSIWRVLVNDVDIPFHTYYNADPLNRWNWVNTGERNGAPNQDALYDGKGDPYGSLACIEIVVYRPKIADDLTTANVRVLMSGTDVRVYAATNIWGDGTYDSAAGAWYKKYFTSNPVWVLLDLLTWGDYYYSSVEMQSFIDAAAVCDELVSYTDLNGETSQHARYSCSLAIEAGQKESLANVVTGLLRGFNGLLTRSETAGGKLQLSIKGPLGAQQPTVISGSNYNTAVSSVNRAGTATNGYVAYKFDESNIIQGSLKITTRSISDSPNALAVSFIDSENAWVEDSNSLKDAADVGRAGQEVAGSLTFRGANSFDQVKRVSATILAETHRGNPRADTGGTYWFELESSFRVVHLKVGHLCLLSMAKYGLTDQLFRVTKIQPTKNYERVKVYGFFHTDAWYTDAWGQSADQTYSVRKRDALKRPALSWGPYGAQPITGNAIYESEEWSFGLQPRYETAKDGSTTTTLDITGRTPVNSFCTLKTPKVALQGTTASTGGSIPGNTRYYAAVCAVDSAGGISLPSEVCTVDVGNTGDLNTITIPVTSWDSATVSYHIFAGTRPSQLTWQASASGTPASITLTAIKKRTWGMPDQEFDRLRIKAKRIQHSGPFGVVVHAVAANTIQIGVPSPGFSADQFNGYDCAVLAKVDDAAVPIADFEVTDTAWDSGTLVATLTVTPDPVAAGIEAGDVLVMRSKPTVSGVRLTDANWVNPLPGAGAGMNVGEEVGRQLRFIAGPGAGETYRITDNGADWVEIGGTWRTTPTSASRYIIEDPTWLREVTSEPYPDNTDPTATTTISMEVSSYASKMLLVQAFTVDGGDAESLDVDSPFREIWILGGPGSGASVTDYDQRTFVLGDGGDIEVGTSVTNPVEAPTGGTFYEVTAIAHEDHPPTGSSAIFDINLDGVSIFGATKMVIPAGATTLQTQTTFSADPLTVTAGQIFTIDIIQVGSARPGQKITVTVRWRKS